ncbi:MAG TPA: threonine synthase [Candidatus Limnocylindrales bacterium]|nr:threonine synthase [Candidatus Limnocylindrales bacterium]
MSTAILDPTATTATPAAAPPGASHIAGLRCRACGKPEQIGPNFVCTACFGPLEVFYDYDVARARLTPETIAARPPGIWRYLELLPVGAAPARGLAVGSTALVEADRLGHAIGIDTLKLKDDTRNPTLSFKDRVVAVAVARAVQFGFDTIACASTGNLAGATAAAAAAAGLRAFVFVPSDLEPAKIDHALSFGATVVRVDGTYDDINRLGLEIADEERWGFVNVNLRPFYAEGSKTLAFEIAEQLGWRLPDVLVGPIASGSLFTKVAKGFDELATIGLVERKEVRFVGGQPAGCSPVATAFAGGGEIVPVREPDTIVRSLAIGSPADGGYAIDLARRTGGSIEAVEDVDTAATIRRLAATEGIFVETAGGVTVAAAAQARATGIIRDGDEVVALLTGNGLKTPDAKRFGIDPSEIDPAPPIAATYSEFSGRYGS